MEFTQEVLAEFDMPSFLRLLTLSVTVRPNYRSRIWKVILMAKAVVCREYSVQTSLEGESAKTARD